MKIVNLTQTLMQIGDYSDPKGIHILSLNMIVKDIIIANKDRNILLHYYEVSQVCVKFHIYD